MCPNPVQKRLYKKDSLSSGTPGGQNVKPAGLLCEGMLEGYAESTTIGSVQCNFSTSTWAGADATESADPPTPPSALISAGVSAPRTNSNANRHLIEAISVLHGARKQHERSPTHDQRTSKRVTTRRFTPQSTCARECQQWLGPNTNRHKNRQTHTDKHTQTNAQTNTQANKHTNKQTTCSNCGVARSGIGSIKVNPDKCRQNSECLECL
jgi:hypothetical protein